MTRNLGAHPTQLMNPTISKFCHSSYMAITLHNLKILLSRLLFFYSTIANFYQSANWNFWGLVIPLNLFRDVSIIITIINNVTGLVSHSVICFRYFMPIGHCVNSSSNSQCALRSQPPLKNITPSSLPSFLAIHPQYIGFSCIPPKIGFFRELP